MHPSRSRLSCILVSVLALAPAACGRDEPRPVATAGGDEAEALPAPAAPMGGSVTGMPDAPGPGGVPLAADAVPVPGEPQAVLYADGVPLPVVPDTSTDGAPVAVIAFHDAGAGDEGLPPLEDEPEAGLAPPPMATSATAPADTASSGQAAADAVRAYYDAVSAGDFARAYAAWSDGGRASGRTPEQFRASFAGARITRVSIGAPGAVEGAAGALLVEVPVTVTSRSPDGRELRQAGSFALRSSGGAGSAGGWHIVSADLRELQP